MGANPNAFKNIQSTDSTRFVNATEGIDLIFDALSDAPNSMISENLFVTIRKHNTRRCKFCKFS